MALKWGVAHLECKKCNINIVQGSPWVMIANCFGEHAPFGPAFSGFSVSAFRSLHVSFEQVIAYFVDLIPGTNALSTFIANL